ncbi:hypothetical protein ALC57_07069 [Trachymyrmex cornetzi]|uniref:Uncharacterized protein n=1 Tax=Trachymyrmex cornetzi TaxID=471704 RepID=A0A195E5V7_9HYME|nr:hypothetical protein ALC57_07069 [Trachymyrmex cornetzi]
MEEDSGVIEGEWKREKKHEIHHGRRMMLDRVSSELPRVDGMEMSGTRSETGKRDRTAEMVSGGGRGNRERRRKKRSTRGGTEREAKRRRILHERQRRTLGTESTRACTGSRRGRRAKPSLVPASSQTNGPSPDAEVARFLRRSFKFTFTD